MQRERISFSKIPPTMELPNLISVQKESFERFMGEGLSESFAEFSPIEGAKKEDAEAAKKQLEEAGAEVTLK